MFGLYTSHALIFTPLACAQDLTLPSQGVVQQGQATLVQGTGNLQINQHTERAVINWQSFNVGKDATVNFNQPSSSAVMLNRVTGSTPSNIYGNLRANGQIFLINSNGIYFGGGAEVSVGALVASTQSISDQQFAVGNYVFQQNQSGAILNDGSINGGYLALIAPQITNAGLLQATQGDVALLSGEAVSLDISPSGRIKVAMQGSELESLITNSGSVDAMQGVQFRANAVQSVVNQTINSPDSIDALVTTNGVVRMVRSTGSIKGKDVTIAAGSGAASINGVVDVSQPHDQAGSIHISGVETEIGSSAYLNAQGGSGGGHIWVGGQWQGQGDMQQALYTHIAAGAVLDASATVFGDGGSIVAWSDITDSRAKTYAHGQFRSMAGIQGGNGGNIETSGYSLNTQGIGVNTQSLYGENGVWLLDPYDITIGTLASGDSFANSFTSPSQTSVILASDISTALATSNVSIWTGSGDLSNTININAAISKTAGASTTALDFRAATININADISSSSDKLNLLFYGNNINLGNLTNDINLTTNGGNIVMRGVSAATTSISMVNSTIITNGGNLSLRANTMAFSTDRAISSSSDYGINLMQTADIMDENGLGGELTIENGVGSTIYLDSFIQNRTSIVDTDPFFFILAADLNKQGDGTLYLNPARHVLPSSTGYSGPFGSIEVMHDLNVNAGRLIMDYSLYNNNKTNSDIDVAAGATLDWWGNSTAFSPYFGTNDELLYNGYDQSAISYLGNISGAGNFRLSNCGNTSECRALGVSASGGTFRLYHSHQSAFTGTFTIDDESTLYIFSEVGSTHSLSSAEQYMVGPILNADNEYQFYWSPSNPDGQTIVPSEAPYSNSTVTIDANLGKDLNLRSDGFTSDGLTFAPNDNYYDNPVNFVVNGILKNYAYNFLQRAKDANGNYAAALGDNAFSEGTIFSGVISGSGTIINDYANTMVITNPNNSFTGALSIQNGTVMLAGQGLLNSSGTYGGFIYNDGLLAFNESWSGNQTLSGGMTGIGSLFKAGNGSLTLSSTTKAYSGGTYILPPASTRIGSADLIVTTGATLGTGTVKLYNGAKLTDSSGASITNEPTAYFTGYNFTDTTAYSYAGSAADYPSAYRNSSLSALRYLHITQSSDTANEAGLLNAASVAWLAEYGYSQGIGARSALGEYDPNTEAAKLNKQKSETEQEEKLERAITKAEERRKDFETAVEEKMRMEAKDTVSLDEAC